MNVVGPIRMLQMPCANVFRANRRAGYFVATTRDADHGRNLSLIGVDGWTSPCTFKRKEAIFPREVDRWVFEVEDRWNFYISQGVEGFILAMYPPEHSNKADGMFRWVHHQIKAQQPDIIFEMNCPGS